MLRQGDRVRLTSKHAKAQTSMHKTKTNWRIRRGTVRSVRQTGNVVVLWDDRKSPDDWPPQALELIMSAAVLHMTEIIKLTVKGRDYEYEGYLAGIATKRSGAIRYIVEDDHGRLFIHSAEQIGKHEGWMP